MVLKKVLLYFPSNGVEICRSLSPSKSKIFFHHVALDTVFTFI